jgi:type IV secretion system protein VirD4
MSRHLDYPIIGDPSPEAVEFGRIVYNNGTIANKMRYGGDRHMLVIGGNRSGKGTRILMPNLLNMSGKRSIVVVDPKGELAAVTAQFRRSLGQRVVIINPFGVMSEFQGYQDLEGVGYNPLCSLDPTAHDFNAKASLLAEAMISVDPKNHNKHFDEAGRALLAATMMYVAIIAREKRAVPTMKHVRQLICMASEAARPPSALFPNGVEGYGIPKLAAKMMTSSIAALRNKAAPFVDWNREIQSVASTVRTQTECFDDYEIAENLAKNDFDFGEIKRQPTTVYLVLPPDQMRRHSGWLRLLLTAALQAALRPRQWGEPSILFMMDEFAALGHLEIIENAWAQVPGYGIQMMG